MSIDELEARRRELVREAKAIVLECVREARQQTAAEAAKVRQLDHEQTVIANQLEDLFYAGSAQN